MAVDDRSETEIVNTALDFIKAPTLADINNTTHPVQENAAAKYRAAVRFCLRQRPWEQAKAWAKLSNSPFSIGGHDQTEFRAYYRLPEIAVKVNGPVVPPGYDVPRWGERTHPDEPNQIWMGADALAPATVEYTRMLVAGEMTQEFADMVSRKLADLIVRRQSDSVSRAAERTKKFREAYIEAMAVDRTMASSEPGVVPSYWHEQIAGV